MSAETTAATPCARCFVSLGRGSTSYSTSYIDGSPYHPECSMETYREKHDEAIRASERERIAKLAEAEADKAEADANPTATRGTRHWRTSYTADTLRGFATTIRDNLPTDWRTPKDIEKAWHEAEADVDALRAKVAELEAAKHVRWPKDRPEQYNASNEPCDMWTGPCSCGAWHTEGR